MTDRVLLALSLAAAAGLVLLAAAAGRGEGRRRIGLLLAGLLLLYGAAMACGWARRAADFDRSTRSHVTSRQAPTR